MSRPTLKIVDQGSDLVGTRLFWSGPEPRNVRWDLGRADSSETHASDPTNNRPGPAGGAAGLVVGLPATALSRGRDATPRWGRPDLWASYSSAPFGDKQESDLYADYPAPMRSPSGWGQGQSLDHSAHCQGCPVAIAAAARLSAGSRSSV